APTSRGSAQPSPPGGAAGRRSRRPAPPAACRTPRRTTAPSCARPGRRPVFEIVVHLGIGGLRPMRRRPRARAACRRTGQIRRPPRSPDPPLSEPPQYLVLHDLLPGVGSLSARASAAVPYMGEHG